MAITFDPIRLPESSQKLRAEVRAFLEGEIEKGVFVANNPSDPSTDSRQFALDAGAAGWIGMTWPREYGGQGRSFLDRYVVTEEMRAVQAPTGRYMTGDRQSGPMLIKYGSERLKAELLPRIIAGELSFCIGMSEPNAGSDLFAAQSRATRSPEGWLLNGTKLWTSTAHWADYMIGYFRTSSPTAENRRFGLSQFLVPMHSSGITVNPVRHMNGGHGFNEVIFEDALIPLDHILGEENEAWKQANSELAYERSGPERFLAEFEILPALMRYLGPDLDVREAEGIGQLVAQVHTIRRMSVSVNGMLAAGKEPSVESSIVKELGTLWQQRLAARARELASFRDEAATADLIPFRDRLARALVTAPQITIQGGTSEILRATIARGLGLR
jgi:alkylation response protein AidB-like acyl-CoA dehydrogenase